MKLLILGNGGREHAIAWKCAQSPLVTHVYVAPGNSGTALENKISNINISATDISALVHFAKENTIELTIVGPEAPLAAGVVDTFQAAGLKCFGPSKFAAQLEASKAFSKDFMQRFNIPTACYATFSDITTAKNYLQQQKLPIVIKADGLAAGKGVVIANTLAEANAALEDMLTKQQFGDAGAKVVIEEFIQGEEASFIVMVDGEHILPFATSQDHKAIYDGDKGPNTGGMGAYSPAPVVTTNLSEKIINTVIKPVVKGMQTLGHNYTGFLYAGIMITPDNNIKVLEFNCRLGDPETQPLLMRLQSDLVELCLLALNKELNTITIQWDNRIALGVVLAAAGYPANYKIGHEISGLNAYPHSDIKIFHAGAKLVDNQVVTNGGRVLCVTALGNTASEAQAKAYTAVNNIKWEGIYFRKDIGYRAILREK